ncbi:MAG: peptide chain release factor 2, partial [Erysipelotrichales bacterium]
SKLLELELEKQREKSAKLKDSNIDVNFGSQIRSYVFHPYSMVKDHRSNYETSDVDGVMSGKIDELISSVLRNNKRI